MILFDFEKDRFYFPILCNSFDLRIVADTGQLINVTPPPIPAMNVKPTDVWCD